MKQELVPISRVPPSGIDDLDAHATGTLMHYEGKFFLATASHVFMPSNPDRQLSALMVSGPSGTLILKRAATIIDSGGCSRESIPIDFGIIRLTPEEAERLSRDFLFLDVMSIQLLEHKGRTADCHIAGYPAAENEPRRGDNQLLAELYRIDATTDEMLLRHSRIGRHKAAPEDYIAIRYDPRRTTPKPGNTAHRPKTFKGMSGGAIYAGHIAQAIPPSEMPITSRNYIGMFIEADDKQRSGVICAYGLSTHAIQKILNHWFRDILPKPS